jgi:hypothetical protein
MKDFDPNQPAEGLGDLLAKLTHALKMDLLAEALAEMAGKEDCGCNERREKLNELVPFKKNKKEEDATEGIKDEPPFQDQSS